MSITQTKLLFYIIIFSTIKFSFSQTKEEINLTLNNPFNKNYTKIDGDLQLTINFNDSKISSLENSYLHFFTFPLDGKYYNIGQIFFYNESENNEFPSNQSTDQFSFKYSKNANLFTLFPFQNKEKKAFLKVHCYIYPCTFGFKASIDKDYANLNLYEENSFYLYNSNSMKNIDDKLTRIKFQIPNYEIPTFENNRKTITVINPGDKEGIFTKLFYIENNEENEITSDKYKIKIGTIFEFSEKKLSEERKYILKIESYENQFITVAIKTSNYGEKENLIISEIIPNSIPKFSLIKKESTTITECYKINEEYINNFLKNNDKNDLLYASIEYFSLPIETYLNYPLLRKNINTNNERYSLNVILTKNYDEYPQICFRPSKKNSENSLMIQLSHISINLLNNYDIYYPLYSGFLYTKTLPPDSLGIYSHISDIHYIEKIFFYLRKIKNDPQMYFYYCDDYPQCVALFNKTKLPNVQGVEKVNNFGEFQLYSKKYQTKTRDLSPDGNKQNFLIVFCPKNTKDFCQFQISIFSELDEINLEKNDKFFTIAEKDDNFHFKLSIKKNDINFKYCDFCVNVTNDDIFFDTLTELNNATIAQIEKEKKKCYRYQIDKEYNDLNQNDIDIIFDIKANKNIDFTLTNEIVNIYEINQTINLNSFVFPYELNLELENIDNYNTDLLLNFYLNDKNDNKEMNIAFDNILIGAMIINQTLLNNLEGKNDINFLNNNINDTLIRQLDKATRSTLFNINKGFISQKITDESQSWYLHLLFYENTTNLKNAINQEFLSQIFILGKETTDQYYLEPNIYLSDEIIIDDNTIINLYHLETESNDILELKFSSNYALNDNFSIYFLSYDKNAVIDLDYCKQKNLTYEESNNGEMYTFVLRQLNNNNVNDITFVVVSQIKKGEISLEKINYLFKYNFYDNSEYNEQVKYDFNETYDIYEKKDEVILMFNSIKKKSETEYPKSEIYIRKINDKNKIKEESFDTFAKIESKYDLIKGTKTQKNGKINITLNKNDFNDDIKYSIIIDIFEENEKFVISKLGKKEKEKENDDDNEKTELLLKILIPIGFVVFVAVIIIIIVCIKKSKSGDLKDNIMKTSFQDEGALIGDNNEAINDENILT